MTISSSGIHQNVWIDRLDSLAMIAFAVLWFASAWAGDAQPKIRYICHISGKVTEATSIHDFERSVIRLRDLYPQSRVIARKSNELLHLLKKGSDRTLVDRVAMDLTLEVNRRIGMTSLYGRVTHPTELARELVRLRDKYPTVEARSKNPGQYVSDLKRVLELTVTGRKVRACFDQSATSEVYGEEIQWIDPLKSEHKIRPLMRSAFVPMPMGTQGRQFKRTLLISLLPDPLDTLNDLGHEMQHGCNAAKLVRLRTKTELDQARAIDELRAYKTGYELFREIAQAAPELVCPMAFVSETLFGRQLMTWGEAFSEIEERYLDGSWPNYLFRRLVVADLMDLESLFEQTAAYPYTVRIRPELERNLPFK